MSAGSRSPVPGEAARHRLPVLTPIGKAQMLRFELAESTPVSLAKLRERLGAWRALRVIASLVWRSIFRDPTRQLPAPKTADEWLTFRQLRPVILLEDSMVRGLGLTREEAFPILRDVILASGTRFLAAFMPAIASTDWRASSQAERDSFAGGLISRLFNARISRVETSDDALVFDVGQCRFADAVRILDRKHLGPLFCEVDAAFVEREGSTLTLERHGTIAKGAALCDFRWQMKQ